MDKTISELIKNISNTKDENINIDNKYDNILECYKTLCIKYIIVAEKSLFTITTDQKIIDTIKTRSALFILDDFYYGIFTYNLKYNLDKNSTEIIKQITDLSEEDSFIVFKKTFKIIDDFYSCLKREDINITNLNDFIKSIVEKFKDYLTFAIQEIIDLISDKQFYEDISFHLSNLDF
tara:strand:+ start:59 stop:592 length:534 start_codon:yes stop_codon:yes gene_type:complete